MGFLVSAPQLPLLRSKALTASRPLPGIDIHCGGTPEPATSRCSIWDLSPSLHCSIIGTCLTTKALRQLFAKLKHPDAKTASDHDLHSRAVRAAGQRDIAGKLLNRMLEKRHEAHVRRFAKAKTAAEVRALWLEAFERGDIPGAYWAVLTHPATGQPLVTEVFGEVHMLSHLVGMSNRADIVRLRELERALGERDERIARQETRIARIVQQRETLGRRVAELEHKLLHRPLSAPSGGGTSAAAPGHKRRLAAEQARSAKLRAQLAERNKALAAHAGEIRQLEEHCSALRSELAFSEAALSAIAGDPGKTAGATQGLAGKRLLYVGGRPKHIEQLRSLATRLGGTLLSHDGGIEDSSTLLPGLVSQANAVLFPVDCVSHQAALQVKRLCLAAGKPFKPLRSASITSFLSAIETLEKQAPAHTVI
jgi:Uncharacterized protein conserved in bacteria (DUF2325)